MPEGPELKYLQELIESKILNKKLYKINSVNTKSIKFKNNNHYIRKIGRKGKLIWLKTSQNKYIHIHLMLTGWLSFEETEYPKYILQFNNFKLYLDSKRKFSNIKILNKKKHKEELDKLGVDIFSDEFTYEKFYELITKGDRKLVTFLLDQKNIAGIGNYIKSESLYIAKINPHVKTSDLNDKQIKKLYNSIRLVAYSVLIDHLKTDKLKIPKDIKKYKPKKLSNPYYFKVYGQERDLKGNKVIREEINGRGTYYVKKLQK